MLAIRDKYYYKCDTLLDGVRKSIVQLLEKNSKLKGVKKNKILFKEGTYSDGLYKLVKGKVKIYQSNPDGKFQIVYLYTKGEYFGFRPILSDSKNPVSAETMEDCQIQFIPREHFISALESSPIMTKNLLKLLSYEFNVWVNLMSSLAHKSVKERVAFSLLILNEKYKKKTNEKISIIDIGREDLASFCGTTTETCVRILTAFKSEKIISSEGRKIKIINYYALLNISSTY